MLDRNTEQMLRIANTLTAEELDEIHGSTATLLPPSERADEVDAADQKAPESAANEASSSETDATRGQRERLRTRESKVSTSCMGKPREGHEWWPVGTQLEGKIGTETFLATVVENPRVKSGRSLLIDTGSAQGTCPIWDSTVRAVKGLVAERGLRAGDDAALFVSRLGRPMTRSAIADVVRKYTIIAARRVPSLAQKRVTPHTLRHTTAMHLLQSGVELNVIRSWLGHVSIATTNHYVEIDLEMKAKALEACRIAAPRRRAGRWNSNPDILAWLEGL